MASLFDIQNEILNCCIDTETGEVIDFEKLEELEGNIDEKVCNILLWIKNLKADAELYKAQKMAFADKQSAAEKKAESLTNYIDKFLDGNKWDKDPEKRVSVSYRASESVEIDNLDDIADFNTDFIKYADPKADKAAIKKALKDGINVPGCHLERNNNIQIK